jgi:hypothetical protein
MEVSNLPKELSSISEQWLAEQWLVAAGVIPDSAIDTLLMYAYAQKGIRHNGVKIIIDRDENNEGKDPSVRYELQLEPKTKVAWKAMKAVESRGLGAIAKKSALLLLAKAGAPVGLEASIKALAEEYLPKQYRVEVVIVD